MHILTDLLLRQGAMLVVLLALGSGPASRLSERFDGAARFALTPAFGLCLGVCWTTTLAQFAGARQSDWTLIVLAVVSLWVSVRVWTPRRPRFTDLAQIALVCLLVCGPLTYTLHARHSVGPVAFNVYDAAGYVPETDALESIPLRSASASGDSLTAKFWAGYAAGFQNLDAAPLEANVNELLGLHATDTQAPFLLILLLCGALGAFAAVRYATRSATPAAALAGALFGGPLFLQLWADSSQAAICGLALLLPFAVVGAETLRGGRTAELVLLGLLTSGLLAVYPLFVPAVAGAGVLVLLALAVIRRGRTVPWRAFLPRVLALVAMAAAFSPVSFRRDLRYWHAILDGTQSFVGLPRYHLPIDVIPGWLGQTQEFYALPHLAGASPRLFGIALIVPLGMAVVILFGLRRFKPALGLVALIAVCALLAEYLSAGRDCSYCVQRNLLPVGPMLAALIALGIYALGRHRFLAAAAALVVVIAVGARSHTELQRIQDQAYVLDSSARTALSHLPAHPGAVQLEGFSASFKAPGEQPLIAYLAEERGARAASIFTDIDDYSGLAYLGGRRPLGPEFKPDYRYVLSRLAGVQNARTTPARSGVFALAQVTAPLDVVPVGGFAVPAARLDPAGVPFVQGAMTFYVTGRAPGPVALRLEFTAREPVAAVAQPGLHATSSASGVLSVCLPASGAPPLRRAGLQLSFAPLPAPLPADETYPLEQVPLAGVWLTAAQALPGGC